MLDKLKQQAMQQGFKLMSNPKVMKMLADPRLMNAISQGFAFKGMVQSQVEHRLRAVAHAFNLATREDLEQLQNALDRMESSVGVLERRVEDSVEG